MTPGAVECQSVFFFFSLFSFSCYKVRTGSWDPSTCHHHNLFSLFFFLLNKKERKTLFFFFYLTTGGPVFPFFGALLLLARRCLGNPWLNTIYYTFFFSVQRSISTLRSKIEKKKNLKSVWFFFVGGGLRRMSVIFRRLKRLGCVWEKSFRKKKKKKKEK